MAISKYSTENDSGLLIRVKVKSKTQPHLYVQKQRKLGEVSKSLAKAQERLLRLEAMRELGLKESAGLPWREILQKLWFELFNGRLAENSGELTQKDYLATLREYTKQWNEVPVSSLNSKHVEQVFYDLEVKGLSWSRKKHFRSAMNFVWECGIRKRLIPPNAMCPAKFARIGKNIKKRQPILTLSEIRRFLDEANQVEHPFYPVWATAFLTGMRSGELWALRWDDVSFERNMITVSHSFNWRLGQAKTTKSGEWREVPINSELRVLIERLRLQTGATGFVLPRLPAWRRGEAAKVTRDFCKALGMREINFHATRACFAVQMLESGVSVPKVMAVGGWSEFKSFQHYLRLAGVEIQEATQSLKLLPVDCPAAKVIKMVE